MYMYVILTFTPPVILSPPHPFPDTSRVSKVLLYPEMLNELPPLLMMVQLEKVTLTTVVAVTAVPRAHSMVKPIKDT